MNLSEECFLSFISHYASRQFDDLGSHTHWVKYIAILDPEPEFVEEGKAYCWHFMFRSVSKTLSSVVRSPTRANEVSFLIWQMYLIWQL